MTSESPKVMIVGGFPSSTSKIFGGIVTSCKLLLDSSLKEHFSLVLIDTTQVSNPPPKLLVRLRLAISRFFYFVKQVWIVRPQAVLLFTSKGASLAEKGTMAWVARFLGVPSLIFPRGGGLMVDAKRNKWQSFWIRSALRGADFFLCQGPAWQRFASEEIGFAPDRVILVPNWTASSDLLKIGHDRVPKDSRNDLRLLFVGWLEKEKGIFDLLEACAHLARPQKFRLTIAGRGKAEDEARKYVLEHGLSETVDFAGWVEGGALLNLYQESDVFVLPSWSEGLPNAMIESMAAGLAVIVSSVGNIPDVIRDEQEALLVPAKDVNALTSAIQRVITSSELRCDLSKRGHDFAAANYAVEPAVQRLSNALNLAIQSRRKGPSR